MQSSQNTVLITGGTKGLGKELSLKFGLSGYYVVALYKSDNSSASLLENEFRNKRIAGSIVQCDVTSQSHLTEKLSSINELNHIQSFTLIHNACSFFEPQPMHLLPWNDFQSQFDVAVHGLYNLLAIFLKKMIKSKQGTVLTVLSELANTNSQLPKGFSAYLAAKYALLGLTQSLKAEYSQHGIQFINAYPGFMNTPLTQAWNEHLKGAILGNDVKILDPKIVAENIFHLIQKQN